MTLESQDGDPFTHIMAAGIVAGGAQAAGQAAKTNDEEVSLITAIFEYFHIAEVGAILGTIWALINIVRWGVSVSQNILKKKDRNQLLM